MKKNYYLYKHYQKENKSKKYDCLIGVSGGFDSTYICYLAKNII